MHAAEDDTCFAAPVGFGGGVAVRAVWLGGLYFFPSPRHRTTSGPGRLQGRPICWKMVGLRRLLRATCQSRPCSRTQKTCLSGHL